MKISKKTVHISKKKLVPKKKNPKKTTGKYA